MTATMYLYTIVIKVNTRVIHILGSVLFASFREKTQEFKKRIIVATIVHFAIGALFAVVYCLLWHWNVFDINWKNSIWVGAVSGLIAIVIWRLIFKLHKNPPDINFEQYAIALVLSHISFGFMTFATFELLANL